MRSSFSRHLSKTLRFTFIGLTVFIGLAFSNVTHASMVLPLTLHQMAVVANRVFEGECLGLQEDLDENGLAVTYVTFSVYRVFKGSVGKSVTIKQFGVKPREEGEAFFGMGPGSYIIPATKGFSRPSFQKGEKVILFLYGDSDWGFTSPVGLGQGKFIVSEGTEGQRTISSALSIQAQGIYYENFIETLRRLPTIRIQD
ncbi:MAG: hypothetical protein A3I75_00985 [Deltaproteobacteria bacterium RIFCSPLOWO2_02_FULL_50_16]|nr:MAG: hypothetical protein A2053_02585 [Deltaproteobacteria bacterium GWA2_50_8]OGQ55872.1 MAG: hypothetical protein A3I75_00985 [Deltaproteobacteria bacterium RIFCSPLOWO2_02_FULL_50_16]OGQ66940.1 MAG: hypothetical protein A3F89_08155 [Deltaproteobacteria bacterium RIFCSPLOWO2_12_FULL_50_11]